MIDDKFLGQLQSEAGVGMLLMEIEIEREGAVECVGADRVVMPNRFARLISAVFLVVIFLAACWTGEMAWLRSRSIDCRSVMVKRIYCRRGLVALTITHELV